MDSASNVPVKSSAKHQLQFNHKSLRAVVSCDDIPGNYRLWYNPFSQNDAIHDFSLLKVAQKNPILIVKQKPTDGTRFPLVVRADEISGFCIENEKFPSKRHFYEVSIYIFQKLFQRITCNFLFLFFCY